MQRLKQMTLQPPTSYVATQRTALPRPLHYQGKGKDIPALRWYATKVYRGSGGKA